jgi:predicted HTH transcriptional regulator
MPDTRTLVLIDDLRALPSETPWVEFKENNSDPAQIGVRISALSNAARLADKHTAYMVWGVRDEDHSVVGTEFHPASQVCQREPLEFWLAKRLNPSIAFGFKAVAHQDGRLILLEIPAATTQPIEFDRTAYIRVGSATPRLSDYPERLQALWTKLQPYVWESRIAAQFMSGDDVLQKLDYVSYFDLTGQPLPDNRQGIFEKLLSDRLIETDVGNHYNITNLGAVLFAKRFADFSPSIARNAVRFVAYGGRSRADTVTHRQDGQRGYASGFKGLIDYIEALLPRNEHIGTAFRTEAALFPPIAIRELVANALIHQDMTVTGSGPLIELFSDRLEITNPGVPLINPDRFIDLPPRSRNESLAALMRRMRICEEQGTGIDKVIAAVEIYQLPAPDFQVGNEATRVILYGPRSFAAMTQEERVRACYQHAVLKYLSGERMRNSTLRQRLGIASQNASQVSQVIKLALEKELIRPADPDHPQAAYVPYWA